MSVGKKLVNATLFIVSMGDRITILFLKIFMDNFQLTSSWSETPFYLGLVGVLLEECCCFHLYSPKEPEKYTSLFGMGSYRNVNWLKICLSYTQVKYNSKKNKIFRNYTQCYTVDSRYSDSPFNSI
jgi:hypothetical protein